MGILNWFLGKDETQSNASQNSEPSTDIDSLIQELSSKDSLKRMDAVEALGSTKDSKALEALINVYENKNEFGGIREKAIAAIEAINPSWQPNLPSVEKVADFVKELVAIFDSKGISSSEAVRNIGSKLNELGGFDLMVYGHKSFRKVRPQGASSLENAWDGIGSWQK